MIYVHPFLFPVSIWILKYLVANGWKWIRWWWIFLDGGPGLDGGAYGSGDGEYGSSDDAYGEYGAGEYGAGEYGLGAYGNME